MQFVQDIADSSLSSIRFAVEIGGVQYKLFSYFPIGSKSDASIALHSYYESTHTYEKRLHTAPQDLSPAIRSDGVGDFIRHPGNPVRACN